MKLNDRPEIMSALVQAIWNEEKGYWTVRIKQNEIRTFCSGDYKLIEMSDEVKVSACDEFVLASALLHTNGINVKELFEGENPIVEE